MVVTAKEIRRNLADLVSEHHGRMVSTLVVFDSVADGDWQTKNVVEFYYPEEIVLFEREFIEARARCLHGNLYRRR